MDLFNHSTELAHKPLAERVRPQKIEDLLLSSYDRAKLSFLNNKSSFISFVLYGPPGVGKTSIMKVVERINRGAKHEWVNAVDISVKELRGVCSKAKEAFLIQSQKTFVFIDEIHRLSKAQQDVLLPSIESGEIVLIGATTEKPAVSLSRPLISRCRVVKLSGVSADSLNQIAVRAAKELGFESLEDFIETGALESLINYSLGDARKLLGLIESLYAQALDFPLKPKSLSTISIDERGVPLSSVQFKVENTSALIKAMRAADLEASMLYLVRLIEGGVDPVYIYRRFLVFASEDIGNADPQALILVQSSKFAYEAMGMPEGYYGLVQMVDYLVKASKCREIVSFLNKTKNVAWSTMSESPPAHLQIKGSGAKTGQNLPKSNIYGFLEED